MSENNKIVTFANILLLVNNSVHYYLRGNEQEARTCLNKARAKLHSISQEYRQEFLTRSQDEEFNTLLKRYVSRFDPRSRSPLMSRGDLKKLERSSYQHFYLVRLP